MPEHLGTPMIRDICRKFPNTPSLTLAKKIYKENKSLFKNIENIRDIIRRIRGTKGNAQIKKTLDKSLFKEHGERNPFQLPESYAEDFSNFNISQSKTLILSDLHIPYHDNQAIELALQYGVDKGANCILINGDMIDFYPISRFEKDPRQRSIKQEFDAVRQFLKYLRSKFPLARIVFKLGNHDERWEKWLIVKAPELLDMEEFQLEVILGFAELGIEIVKNKRPITIGKLIVLHGHEVFGTGGVNPARAIFTKTLESVLVGHYHRTSQHSEPSMSGHTFSAVSQGCLCGLNPAFMPINKWNLGFSFCELQIKTGDYELHNKQIIKGKVF